MIAAALERITLAGEKYMIACIREKTHPLVDSQVRQKDVNHCEKLCLRKKQAEQREHKNNYAENIAPAWGLRGPKNRAQHGDP